jgi:radical SAM protein with 4Fe4S-binding SPASM domain
MDFLTEELAVKSFDKRIPFDVSFELTRRCNQKCSMCYLPSHNGNEMDTETVKRVLNKLAAAQCLFLTFTGGELFLREDAGELIDYATDAGFAVTVKTNGVVVDASLASRLKEYKVLEVHVSLLGGSAATHDMITGVPGSFDKVCTAVSELTQCNIPVVIMSVITRGHIGDIVKIDRLAKQWGLDHVNFTALIFPRFPGDKNVQKYRLTDRELQQYYSTLQQLHDTESEREPQCKTIHTDERFLSCTALQSGITIAPDGTVYACSALPIPLGNIITDTVEEIVFSKKADSLIADLQLSATPACAACSDRIGCVRCPGLSYMDNNTLGTVPFEACRHTFAFKTVQVG